MSAQVDDARFMARALQLAEQGLYTTHPNPRVGCVLVQGGAIIAEGAHLYAGEPHAEVHALRAAGTQARGATAYVTLEPCCHTGRTPPCTDALIAAQVARVVVAMTDPNPLVAGKGAQRLQAAGIAVDIGCGRTQAEQLNPGFIMRMREGRPYVRSKMAVSLDGRTALANGVSKWITGEAARADVQRWRARSSAVMTGIGTILADDPALTVRAWPVRKQPLRVVIDRRLRTPPGAQVLRVPGTTLIATRADPALKQAQALNAAGAEVVRVDSEGGTDDAGLDFMQLLQTLAAREINEILVEAGAGLNGALLARGLIDELIVYMAPHVLGNSARGMFVLPELQDMDARVALEIVDARAVGTDWRMIAKVSRQTQ